MAEAKREKPGTVIRAQGELLRQIDAYAKAVEEKTGVRVSRTATAEALIRLGLRVAADTGIA